MTQLTEKQREILDYVQLSFPIDLDPYDVIACDCGATPAEAFDAVTFMHDSKDIRRLGGIFDSSHLGYCATLCAIRVDDPEDIESVAAVISSFPGVTHNYQRNHEYNIWFTVIARGQSAIDEILGEIADRSGYGDILDLPALNLFKVQAAFSTAGKALDAEPPRAGISNPRARAAEAPEYDEAQQELIRFLQADFAGDEHPLDTAASVMQSKGFDWSPEDVMNQCREWQSNGTLRRFSAIIRHQRLGYTANAMGVWDVPDEDVALAGEVIAANPHVSHAYQRVRDPRWEGNVYSMLHGYSQEECHRHAKELHRNLMEAGVHVEPARLLFSTREFKKSSMKYFSENIR